MEPVEPISLARTELLAPVAWGLGAFLLTMLLALIAIGVLSFRSQRDWRDLARLAIEKGQPVGDLGAPPLGMPEGSVRAAIAVLIIVVSLALVGALIAGNLGGRPVDPPDLIATLVGSVLGFYFGSRQSAETRKALDGAIEQAQSRTEQADRVAEQSFQAIRDTAMVTASNAGAGGARPADANPSTIEKIASRAEGAIALASAVAAILPPERGKTLSDVASSARTAVEAARTLLGQNRQTEALVEARKGDVEVESSLRSIFGSAVEGLGAVSSLLGPALPPAALILALTRIGVGLGGRAYERWRNEMLGAPHSPELFPPGELTPQEAWAFIDQVPILASAFAAERQRVDNAFAGRFLEAALSEADAGAVLAREEFLTTAAGPRQAASGVDLDREMLAEAVVAFQKLVRADRLRREVAAGSGENAEGVLGAVDAIQARAEVDESASQALGQIQKVVLALDAARSLGGGSTDILLKIAQAALAPSADRA